jgi:hypothetical protein
MFVTGHVDIVEFLLKELDIKYINRQDKNGKTDELALEISLESVSIACDRNTLQ